MCSPNACEPTVCAPNAPACTGCGEGRACDCGEARMDEVSTEEEVGDRTSAALELESAADTFGIRNELKWWIFKSMGAASPAGQDAHAAPSSPTPAVESRAVPLMSPPPSLFWSPPFRPPALFRSPMLIRSGPSLPAWRAAARPRMSASRAASSSAQASRVAKRTTCSFCRSASASRSPPGLFSATASACAPATSRARVWRRRL
mmetsp:Transcript_18710/g.61187  ORF Transcript_18710/g.61187 Transcript_18710/m.61187 type:complete len:204 (+) Transcript_18710:332-943(+)